VSADADVLARIAELERVTSLAWPPAERLGWDGWWLGASGGHGRRINSVHPEGRGRLPLAEKIEYCEAFYAARQQPSRFKLTAAAQPPELDAQLAARGYARVSPTGVQLRDLATPVGPRPRAAGARVLIEERLSPGWRARWARLNRLGAAHEAVLIGVMQRAPGPRAFGSVAIDGQIVALGFATCLGSYVGLAQLHTAAPQRRRGWATLLIERLLGWAQAAGAKTAWLQVELDNPAALALYARLGFRSLYEYWYREREGSPRSTAEQRGAESRRPPT
jgi:ribosomal protein S18 acetylase RimI-like enzyme